MRTQRKRFFSILLTLAMILGMIPAVSAPATATDEATPIEATTPLQLCEQLNALGDAYIQLQPRDTPEYTDYVWKTQMPILRVYGNKILDLNGVTVEKRYSNDTLAPEAVMVIVNEGASLTIIDSRGGGGLSIVSTNLLDTKSEFEENPPVRDLFHVDGGTLIINGGTFTAGNSEDFWVTWGAKLYDTSASSYCGNIHYQTTGSVVTLNNGSTFVANDGHFEGRGYIKYPTYLKDEIIRNSTVKTDGTGNHVYINAGTFKGMGGANVFSLGANDQIDVRGGSFSLHHHKRLWCYDTDHFAYYYSADKGLIGLDNFWVAAGNVNYLPYVMKAKWNNTVWSGHDTASTKHDFMMTGAHFDGDVITYLPSPYTLPGGNLSLNGKASAEGYWNINQSAYVSCDVRTYYQQTDTIPEHRLTYTWTIKDGDGNAVSTNRTDTNKLNLSTIWASGKDELVISCQVEESGPSGTWGYFSKPITIHLSDLPLSEAKLPDGGIELDVEYGKTTKNDDYAVITVRPDQATVEDAFRFVDSVAYSLAYTDILGQSATAKINNGSYFIIETEAGDTKATLTMTLTDIHGKESTFTESVWLLRLPEIKVTANSLRMSSDGSRYLITKGDTSAKLAFDATNMDAERFVGWYQTFKGIVSEDMTFTPTDSGIYNYRYYSKDGKLIISEPVTIDFTDYSSVTKKSEDAVYFYAPEDSGKPTDSVLTIELGTDFNQVSNPSVQWVLKSYPAGGKYAIKTETLSPTAITMQSGYPVNFSDFLDDSNGFVMPGDYVVQPVITFATQDYSGLTAYGDAVTVTVHKYVDEIKPTANGKVIENDDVITLPVGESLDLSWTIGKYSEYDTANSAWYVDMGAYAEDTVAIEGETFGSTYQGNIKLTAQKPGQVKIRMSGSATKDGLDDYMSGGIHNFTVNIPVTTFEVTMDEPVENAKSGSDYFKTPEGALYTANTIWLNEQQAASGKFIPGIISRANVHLTVAEGYALPEDLSDITLKINGEVVSLEDVEYPSITSQDFRFVYNFGQLVFNKDIIEGQDIEFPIPTVGDAVDQYPSSSNNTALFGETGGLKMWADWLDIVDADDGDDGDFTNDNATSVSRDAVYEAGKTYRLTMSVSLYSSYVLGEGFVPTVNGSNVEHDFNFGDTSFRAYYYFTPRPLVDEILLEMEAPMAFSQPTSLELLNDGSALVYPSSIQWFIDANENGQLDENEGTAADFNADGSFKSNTAYSMMVVMHLYDNDHDGIGDDAAFADTITVKHDDESGSGASVIDCTITRVEDDETVLGIFHTFAATGSVDYALVATPNVLTFDVVEGYTAVEAQTFTVESLGTSQIPAEQLTIFNETGCFEITQDGYQFTVQPLAESLPTDPGNSDFSVMVYYEDEADNYAYADVAIHFNIAEAYVDLAVEPESLTFYGTEGYESIESQSFQIKNTGNTDLSISPYTVTVRNESVEFDVTHEGEIVTVTPVQGLTEGTYEATLLVMANNYDIVIPVPITFYVDPQPEYGLTIDPETCELNVIAGYDEDTCATFILKNIGKNQLKADDLEAQIQENASPENFIFNRYEFSDQADGTILLKVYPKTGIAPIAGEPQYGPYFSSIYAYAWNEDQSEQLTGVSGQILFTVGWPSYELSTRPASLDFSANKGYTDLSETIRVFSMGTGEVTAIKANVYEADGGLSENFTAAVDGMTVTITPKTGLDAGVYTAVVEIKDVDNRASTTVPLTFTVNDYQITVSPESFSFNGKEGSEFYFTDSYTASATNGGQPAAVMAELEGFIGKAWEGGFALSAPVDAESIDIPAGTYTGYLVLSIPDTDYSKKVPITVTIAASDYRLSVSPEALDFSLLEGYTAADMAKTVTISNIGADPVTDIIVEQPFGTTEPPAAISVADGENGSKIITVTPKADLAEGTYTTAITVRSESGKVADITIPVTITVSRYTYTMTADTTALSFTATEAYESVAPQIVTLTSTGTGMITQLEEVYFKSDNGMLDTDWFTVTSQGMTVTIAPVAGLESGTYTGYLMISAKGTNLSIPVTFEVGCDHSNYSEWSATDSQFHHRFCEQCGTEETAEHNWKVYMVREPQIGVHGLKRSTCQDCDYRTGLEVIPALEACFHACSKCGGCLAENTCWYTFSCECDEPGSTMEYSHVEAAVIDGEDGMEVIAVAIDKEEAPTEELHPYEKYVVDHMHGYMVETIYDISVQLNGGIPDQLEEPVTVCLYVGQSAAQRIADGTLYLVHITDKGRVIYGTQPGQTPLTVDVEAGTVTFETDEFSPFVLASAPGTLELEVEGKTTAKGCEVTLTSNAAETGNLYLAVYDSEGKMLDVDVISNFTFGLQLSRTFEMEFEGDAASVKAFLLQDTTFLPKHAAAEDLF